MAYIGNGPGSIRQGRRAVYEFTSTANQTAFSGTDENGLTLDLLQANDNDVYLNGVRLIITDDYTISGDVLTLTSGAASGDKLIIMTQDEIANDASYSKAASDSRYINYDGDVVNGTIQIGGSGNNITFADNNKVVFGDGSDLEIFHNGINNFIDATGVGDLYLRVRDDDGDVKIQADNGSGGLTDYFRADGSLGQAQMYHYGAQKLNTTSTGIDVTGIVTATGNITAGSSTAGVVTVGSANGFEIQKSGVNGYINQSDNGPIIIRMGSSYSEKMRIDASGNLGIGTSSPEALLHLKSTATGSTPSIIFENTNNAQNMNIDYYNNGGAVQSRIQYSEGPASFNFIPNVSTSASALYIAYDGKVGIGTTSSAHKLDVAGTTKAEQYLLDAVAKDINNTAVDVFIYDTRKDSDGGAWRKRTQHTSWYNETLNTATRGARKEFPAVAVIVVQSTQIKIFDGDDPDLPMWMVWSGSIGYWSNNIVSISAKNGWLFAGVNAASNNHSMGVISFPNDIKTITDYASSPNFLAEFPVSQRASQNIRHSNATHPLLQSSPVGSGRNVNDIAMTVLPNATIDTVTGLPLPTIAVATSGGTSVIRDDGRSVGVMTSNSYGVAFTKNYELVHTVNDASSTFTNHIREIPSADTTTTATRRYFRAGNNTGSVPSINNTSGETTANILATLPNNTLAVATNGTSKALNILQEVPNAPATGMIAYVASDYNTGWMNGDIKLATLSSTDDTNAGAEIVTNGDFATNSDWTLGAGWTISGGKATHDSTTGNRYLTQGGILEEGKQYVLVFTISDYTSGILRIYGGTTQPIDITEAVGTFTIPFIAAAGGDVNFQSSVTQAFVGSISNVSCKLAEQDRSVNGSGIQVFGTVTKTAVATGAELMGYSGFSSSNYLRQPYNSVLNFGTGSYSIMGWFKTNATDSLGYLASLGTGDNDESLTIYISRSNYGIYFDYGLSNQYSRLTQTSDRELVTDTNWHHFVCHVSAGGAPKIYVNGINKEVTVNANAPSSFTFDTDYVLNIGNGRGVDNSGPFGGSIALLRISTTVPSPAQVAKIYNDEKFLFQENAKATLYGSSDAVTALAYDDDTELLHAGTSAGRSVFQGLRRIDNTTDAVGAAISASNGMVAED